jgi:hypothetical protein
MKYDCCWFDGEIDGEPGSDRINMHREFSSRRSIVLSELPEFFRECKCVASVHSVEWLAAEMPEKPLSGSSGLAVRDASCRRGSASPVQHSSRVRAKVGQRSASRDTAEQTDIP